jgi:hypothetical protein
VTGELTTPGKMRFTACTAAADFSIPPFKQSSKPKRLWRTGFEYETTELSTKFKLKIPQPWKKSFIKRKCTSQINQSIKQDQLLLTGRKDPRVEKIPLRHQLDNLKDTRENFFSGKFISKLVMG